MRDMRRRELVAAAGALALALGPGAGAASALDRKRGLDEPGALTALIVAELHAAYAYERSGLDAGTLLANHEDQHARALASLLDALGHPIPAAPASNAQLQPSAAALVARRSRDAAIVLEQALIEGCARQIVKLGDPGMIRTVATVMASHAQHLRLHRNAADTGVV